MFPGWDKVTPPVRCYMKLCDCRRAAPPVRRVCIGLFHARKMFRHIKAQSVKSSKLVVKSIWNPANVLVFQGFFGIIKIFMLKWHANTRTPRTSKCSYRICLFFAPFLLSLLEPLFSPGCKNTWSKSIIFIYYCFKTLTIYIYHNFMETISIDICSLEYANKCCLVVYRTHLSPKTIITLQHYIVQVSVKSFWKMMIL